MNYAVNPTVYVDSVCLGNGTPSARVDGRWSVHAGLRLPGQHPGVALHCSTAEPDGRPFGQARWATDIQAVREAVR